MSTWPPPDGATYRPGTGSEGVDWEDYQCGGCRSLRQCKHYFLDEKCYGMDCAKGNLTAAFCDDPLDPEMDRWQWKDGNPACLDYEAVPIPPLLTEACITSNTLCSSASSSSSSKHQEDSTMAIPLKGLSAKLKQFLLDQSFTCDAGPRGSAQLVMLRGCKVNADGSLSDNGNATTYTDRYDDTMVAFGNKPGTGAAYLQTFRASAKPGLAWINHQSYASSGQGCPTVQPGQYRYQRGDHRGHEALRQCPNSPVVVIRDLDDDARLEATDLVDYPMTTGINIHAGGSSAKVGLNSSGCQVIWGGWGGEPWKLFHHLVYEVAAKQTVFHYTLVDFTMFGEWHDAGPKKPKHVLFGSVGFEVTETQKFLADEGFFAENLIDGRFGRTTDRSARAWQEAIAVAPDGILGV